MEVCSGVLRASYNISNIFRASSAVCCFRCGGEAETVRMPGWGLVNEVRVWTATSHSYYLVQDTWNSWVSYLLFTQLTLTVILVWEWFVNWCCCLDQQEKIWALSNQSLRTTCCSFFQFPSVYCGSGVWVSSVSVEHECLVIGLDTEINYNYCRQNRYIWELLQMLKDGKSSF